MAIEFTLNGEERAFAGDPRTPLLDVLRDDCRLTSTKSVCRAGFCGACTVMIDGAPVPACQRPIGMLEGAEIVTIEGISPPEELNPVQRAFLEHDVVQCGMCFPGMVITLTDFLRRNDAPSRGEVKAALSGNMCRCTGYERIIDAVMSICAMDTQPVEAVSR
ncbi:(2Fe-2S)-binding protein [Pseudogemmobacter sonorensis]|uniref:(2Fe-2S)-binding protein n=1 Tax=Pseudogemmobacter sonorensis TaxID=2989681 RepID=UPI0036C52938